MPVLLQWSQRRICQVSQEVARRCADNQGRARNTFTCKFNQLRARLSSPGGGGESISRHLTKTLFLAAASLQLTALDDQRTTTTRHRRRGSSSSLFQHDNCLFTHLETLINQSWPPGQKELLPRQPTAKEPACIVVCNRRQEASARAISGDANNLEKSIKP